jgi:serine/threonine-protein phosphatase PP1 catalytic subunit
LSVKDLIYAFEGVTDHDFVQSLDNVIEVLQRERKTGLIVGGKIRESFAELSVPKRLVIVGDIHGDLTSLRRILTDMSFEAFLGDPNNKLIFLGDYVDRGTNSIGVIFVICRLKKKFPDSVILMRGNHEAPVEFPFPSHDLQVEVIRRYGYDKGKLIYNKKILPLFRLLTLATLIEGSLFLVHGGVPTGNLDHSFKDIISTADQTYLRNSIMEEILWNDPRQSLRTGDWEYSRRGIGKHFGIEISRKWLRLSNTRVIVRGHEPCQGFRVDHDGSVMTLFSCREAYPTFQASYLFISNQELESANDAVDLSYRVIKI